MEGNFTTDLLFIIVVLVVAAALGFLLGYLVNARYKKAMAAVDAIKAENDAMKIQLGDLNSYRKSHAGEYNALKSDLSQDEASIKELQSLKLTVEELKHQFTEHSHVTFDKELAAIKSKLAVLDERTAPVVFDAERAGKVMGIKIAKDDLTIVEGIGPKIADILKKSRIGTWEELGRTNSAVIKAILLKEGGEGYAIHDPMTWPEQAKMAADGKWDLLKEYQEYLKGGRSPEKA